MNVQPGNRRWARVAVVIAIGGSAVFGLYLAYLAWTVNSFPVEEKPFGDYAGMSSMSFNGTEISFNVTWLTPGFLPLKAQLNSPTTDAANTPACWLDLTNVSSGQVIAMPFAITKPSQVISDLSLYIAVRSMATGEEFTIVYPIQSISAQPGIISPSSYTCSEPSGNM